MSGWSQIIRDIEACGLQYLGPPQIDVTLTGPVNGQLEHLFRLKLMGIYCLTRVRWVSKRHEGPIFFLFLPL
jgi:hypothetical protein